MLVVTTTAAASLRRNRALAAHADPFDRLPIAGKMGLLGEAHRSGASSLTGRRALTLYGRERRIGYLGPYFNV